VVPDLLTGELEVDASLEPVHDAASTTALATMRRAFIAP
jgi:hypothetical protein